MIFVLTAVQAAYAIGVTKTIAVGKTPEGVAYDSGKGEIFVANYGSGANSVSVISDSNNQVIKTITVGTTPWGLTYDSAKGEIFVSNWGSNSVSVISDSSNTVIQTIAVGEAPWGLAYAC